MCADLTLGATSPTGTPDRRLSLADMAALILGGLAYAAFGPDSKERTELMSAAENGYISKLQQLLSNAVQRAPINYQSKSDGRTALMQAARYGQLACVKVLLQAGARFDLYDHSGSNAADLARSHGYGSLANQLPALVQAQAAANSEHRIQNAAEMMEATRRANQMKLNAQAGRPGIALGVPVVQPSPRPGSGYPAMRNMMMNGAHNNSRPQSAAPGLTITNCAGTWKNQQGSVYVVNRDQVIGGPGRHFGSLKPLLYPPGHPNTLKGPYKSTVVLTRDDGVAYRIVQTESNPNTIVWAPMSSFGQKSVWMKIG